MIQFDSSALIYIMALDQLSILFGSKIKTAQKDFYEMLNGKQTQIYRCVLFM